MPYKTITVPGNAVDPVKVTVEMPQFDDENKIIVNYQVWLIYGNNKDDVKHGTNSDSISDQFELSESAQNLKGKMLRIDYTLINGKNADVNFYTSINNSENIEQTLTETISISSFKFI